MSERNPERMIAIELPEKYWIIVLAGLQLLA